MALQLSSWNKPDVVVGLGNEIVRDDGVGILAARRLEHILSTRGDIEVVALPWAGFALLDVLGGRRRAAMIDCLVTGRHAPGTIVRLDEHDFSGSVRLVSFHDVDFPTVLALGRKLGFAMPEQIAVWAVEGGVVGEFGEGLSAPVAAAVDRVVGEVLEFMEPQRTSAAEPIPGAARPAEDRAGEAISGAAI